MRQPSIYQLEGDVIALQCVVAALLRSLPLPVRYHLARELPLQADQARALIVGADWAGPVMPAFEESMEGSLVGLP